MGYLKLSTILAIGKRYWVRIILVIILLVSFGLMIFSARSDSLVVDEKVHLTAGYLHVWQGDYTFNREHPPLLNDLAGLFAKLARPNLPKVSLADFKGEDQWQYGDLFFYHSGNDVEKLIFFSRLPFIFLALGLIYLVFIWAREVFGPKAGLMAAALVGFCPNILAHGRLATTDAVAFFYLLAVWLLRKYIFKASWINAVLLGIGLALVVLAKFSGIIILPVLGLGLLYFWLVKRPRILQALGQLLIILVTALVLSWLVYLFSMRGELSSPVLLAPIHKFIQGYNILADHNRVGHWNYLNGQISFAGWWYYFPLVLGYKLTLPSLILFGMALIFGFYAIKRKFIEEFLLIFPGGLFLVMAMTSHIDIGIRHILPVLPFLYIFISRLANLKDIFLRPIVAGLLILHVAAGILAYPNYIAYFNQIAGGPNGGINHLIDSNLDWNQNMKRFAAYAKAQNIKEVYTYCWDLESFQYYGVKAQFLPTKPVKGVVVICAHQLKIKYDYDFSWVEKYPFDDVIAQGLYIWRFDQKPVQ